MVNYPDCSVSGEIVEGMTAVERQDPEPRPVAAFSLTICPSCGPTYIARTSSPNSAYLLMARETLTAS